MGVTNPEPAAARECWEFPVLTHFQDQRFNQMLGASGRLGFHLLTQIFQLECCIPLGLNDLGIAEACTAICSENGERPAEINNIVSVPSPTAVSCWNHVLCAAELEFEEE